MDTSTRRRELPALLGVVLLAAPLAALLLTTGTARPAAAATVAVVLSDQPPAPLSVAQGDSVQFVNGESAPLGQTHRVRSTQQGGSTAWTYDSRDLLPGATSAPVVFDRPGTYLYLDHRGLAAPLGADTLGRIVVTAAPPAPSAPPPSGAAAPPAAGSSPAAAPPPAGRAPAPAGTGSGTAALTPLGGTSQLTPFSGGTLPGQQPGAIAQAPAFPPLAVGPLSGLLPADAPAVAAPTGDSPAPIAAVPGPLPGAAAKRGLGLAATLAAVAVAGAVSLLVRVLLAEPAASRRPLVAVLAE